MTNTTFQSLKDILSGLGSGPRGIRLPTERELAEALGVNRSTVRERLAALEGLGLIRRTQGSGTYLALPDSSFVQFYFEMALQLGHFTLAQLEEARELLEREVAYLAATHATAEDIAELEARLSRVLRTETADSAAEEDHRFHMTLARASHNPVLVLIQEGLSSVLRHVVKLRQRVARKTREAGETIDRLHIPIVEAVRAHDPEAAAAAMNNHFAVWTRVAEQAARPSIL